MRKKPDELKNHPDQPPHFPWVWSWFLTIRNEITWQELHSWSRMTGIKPVDWECALLFRLDALRN